MASDKPLAIIYTEGKTDWKHLKKAKEKLNIDIPIVFDESEEPLGGPELLKMCEYLSRQKDDKLPGICIFDRDDRNILSKVEEKEANYKNWKNKFYSFVLPIPEHREGYDENICIEFYYTDDELRTKDKNDRRLFLSTEFRKRSGMHKYYEHVLLGPKLQSKITDEEIKAKIIDSEVMDVSKNDINIALSKNDFAENILNDIPPFNNFNFEPFRKVFDIIEEILQKEILPSLQPEPAEEELPPRFFIGREEQFELFEKYLKRNQPISIEGLGGIGKTAFAEKCIEKFKLEDRAVWFPCTQDSKLDSLIEMAGFPDLLKIEKLTELAKYSGLRSLLERHKKILFLDDFQEITDSSFTNFFQFADKRLQNAKIILIAREHPEIRVLTLPIRLQGLEDDHAFDYAKYIIEHNYPELNTNEQDLQTIVQQFKGHPLAIELAIYLLDFGTSPEHLLQAIVEHENEEFLARRLLDEIFTHPKSTQEEKEFMLAFSVFRGKVKEQALTYLFEGNDVTSTVRRLRRKLMLLSEDGCYETHPLVREFCYDRLSDKQKWHKKAAEYFQSERTEQLDPGLEVMIFYHLSSSEQWQALVEMICAKGEQFLLSGYTDILKDMMDASSRQSMHSPQFDLFYGEIAEIQGEWDQALHYFEHAFSSLEANEKLQAQGRIQYGEILRSKGDVKASLTYFEQGYEMSRAIHFQRGEARSLNNIGLAYQFLGDLDAAKMKIEESLKLSQQMGNISDIADSLNNLGRILHEQGELQSAWDKYQHSLKLYEEIGKKSGMATSFNNLGGILKDQGDLQGAWEKYRRSLQLCEEMGEKSGIATSLNNLGGILHKQGDLQGAWDKYQRSLQSHEEIGEKSGMATSLNNLGGILHKQGDLQGARDKYQRSLKLYEEIGEKSGIAISLNNLGGVLKSQGDLQGAWDKFQNSLKLYDEIGEKLGIAMSFNNLGYIFQDQGDLQGAWDKFQRSLAIREEIGEKSGIATSLNNLGRILQDQEDLQGAWNKFQNSLKLYEEIGEKLGIAMSLNNLGSILHDQGDLQGAGDKYQRGLKLLEEIGDKSEMATSLNNLGLILQAQGDLQGAWEKYQQSLHLREEIGDKSGIVNSLHNLGSLACSEKKKDYALALQYFFKSKMLQNQIGIPRKETEDYIFEIRKKLGLLHFKIAVQEALQQLPDDVKEYVDIEKFTQDTTVRRTTPKVGRNDPCPCGSGKKYKKCCGR